MQSVAFGYCNRVKGKCPQGYLIDRLHELGIVA